MRVGQNPAKSVTEVAQPANITVAVVVYIPFLGGYYQQSLDVLKLCLESIQQNTQIPFDLLVFDNASCEEVRQYLQTAQAEGKIQFLTLSDKNIGKVGAWNYIFGAAPGKFVAYADADVYHYPGWLSPLVDVLEKVPKVGMMTGLPLLPPEQYSTATIAWAEDHPDIHLERGKLLPWEDFWRHAGTLGGGEEKARAFYEENDALQVTIGEQHYFIGASHFQFVSRKEILQEVGTLHADRPMGQVRQFDEAINALGYLRLCTPDWHVQHVGNTMPGKEFWAGQPQIAPADSPATSRKKTIWQTRLMQKVLRWVYDRSFNILYRN